MLVPGSTARASSSGRPGETPGPPAPGEDPRAGAQWPARAEVGLHAILGDPPAMQVFESEVPLALGVPVRGRPTIPRGRLGLVAGHPLACLIEPAQLPLGLRVALLRRAAIPGGGGGRIAREPCPVRDSCPRRRCASEWPWAAAPCSHCTAACCRGACPPLRTPAARADLASRSPCPACCRSRATAAGPSPGGLAR